jgi:hypothetical protein
MARNTARLLLLAPARIVAAAAPATPTAAAARPRTSSPSPRRRAAASAISASPTALAASDHLAAGEAGAMSMLVPPQREASRRGIEDARRTGRMQAA